MVHKMVTKDSLVSPSQDDSKIDINASDINLPQIHTAVKEKKKKLGQSKTKSVSFQLDFLMNDNYPKSNKQLDTKN